ncbi:MAG: SRPBCC domain-containing protein [Silvibacterium sp.]
MQHTTSRPLFLASRRQIITGSAAAIASLAFDMTEAWAAPEGEISNTGEAIHQERVFKASRERVYAALTNTKQFDQIERLGEAAQMVMAAGSTPTSISSEAGGAFTLFGGHIIGRQIELVPAVRLVQAWRVVTWQDGVYSIAQFQLFEQDSGTKLVFDHKGFPKGRAQELAEGWQGHYWGPLEKYLA